MEIYQNFCFDTFPHDSTPFESQNYIFLQIVHNIFYKYTQCGWLKIAKTNVKDENAIK